MKNTLNTSKPRWTRTVYIIGVVASILGILDPMEGSVLLMAGAVLIAVSTYFSNDRYWKVFLATAIMQVVGVFFLFFFSSLGGFPPLSWWWSILILPYPIGWLTLIVMLIVRAVKQKRERKQLMNSPQGLEQVD